MKKSAVSVFMIAGLLSVLLSGCQTGVGPVGGTLEHTWEPVSSTEEEVTKEEDNTGLEGAETQVSQVEQDLESEKEEQISTLPYQFVRKYGIIKSEYPVYELDTVIELKLPQKEKEVSLTFAVGQKRELIIGIIMDDFSEIRKIPAGGEPPADGMYYTLKDGTMVGSEKYQQELWSSGEGLSLTGPGIPEAGITPQDSIYMAYPAYFEVYGNRRYIIEARFELPAAFDHEDNMAGYRLRLLDFEQPFEFALKRAPEYGTLEDLAAEEHGSMDTHDGISIISMGEKEKEGVLVSWYVYNEGEPRRVNITYNPPLQEVDLPTISSAGKEYPTKRVSAHPFWDSAERYRLSDVERYGRRLRCLFDVPQAEQKGPFRMNIPGITLMSGEEAAPVTLTIPETYEELNQDIPWKEGSVRILGITRMKEPQRVAIEDVQRKTKVRERPAVYIDVTAVHGYKDLALRGLICERKLQWTGWERERYDFDGKGNLSGFRVFYEEGDKEVTLKFSRAAFYWSQPYVMELPLSD